MIQPIVADNFHDIYHGLLNAVDKQPTVQPTVRKIKTKEIMGASFVLTDPLNNWVLSKSRNPNAAYALLFSEYILTGGKKEDLDKLIELNPSVKRYVSQKHLPENFSVNYGERIARQLPKIIAHLKEDPESRRAVIHILEEGDKIILDSPSATMEYPCTSLIQFLQRDGKLNMFVNMRSQNVALTIIYDVVNFTSLQIHVAKELGIELGVYHHYMTSAHFFDKEQEKVTEILNEYFYEST